MKKLTMYSDDGLRKLELGVPDVMLLVGGLAALSSHKSDRENDSLATDCVLLATDLVELICL